MSLHFETFVLGKIENNTYLLWEDQSAQAVVIDPSFDPVSVVDRIKTNQLDLTAIWLTHGHFDHFIGISDIQSLLGSSIPVFIHEADLPMYRDGGLAKKFGLPMPLMPEPSGLLIDNALLHLGNSDITVMHTPGHSGGHVVFHANELQFVFTGDLIFKQSVGRTDLQGSDQDQLLQSIYTRILTLPGDTVLMPGHGESTSVVEEIEFNPYLN